MPKNRKPEVREESWESIGAAFQEFFREDPKRLDLPDVLEEFSKWAKEKGKRVGGDVK